MKFKCIKNFYMNVEPKLAFKKGKIYNFAYDTKDERYPYYTIEDELDSSLHTMSEYHMSHYFQKIAKTLRNINLRRDIC